ncbi:MULTISPECIES: ATP-grasp domain-containing protein [unclassified Streptomyces]|uniref:ATP-grasp domain-containing protein n=1 Tax=unclassified Streptomyces TaxID=2593676 RepID=UPI00278C2BA6|nr:MULTISPECIES: ATP-grasp domain-containing protein [unclassified Streptomyces]
MEEEQTAPPHVIVLCTDRRRLPARILEDARSVRVSVIVDEGHSHTFGPDVTVHHVPTVRDPDAVLRTVLSIAVKDPVDRIVSPVEHSVRTAGYVRSTLGMDGDGYDISLAFTNKYVMKKRLSAAGLPTAEFQQVLSFDDIPAAAEKTGWPCVVKPVFGGGCIGVTVLESPEHYAEIGASELGAELREDDMPLIVERFVEMENEFHCDAVVRDGEVVFAAPSRYFAPILGQTDTFSGSYLLPAGHEDFDTITGLNRQVVRALGLRDGVTHLELFKTADGFTIGEIAGRPGGGGIVEAVRRHCGVDLWQAFWACSLGETPELDPRCPDRILATVMLPTRPGRITRLSTVEELSGCAGVVSAAMSMRVGDVIPRELTSATSTGLVFFSATDEAEVQERLSELAGSYTLEVEPGVEPGVEPEVESDGASA